MATGKTNARFYRLILNGIDASGDARQVGEFGQMHDTSPVHGWNSGVMYYTLGPATRVLSGFQSVLNKGGTYDELSAFTDYDCTLAIGVRAAPAVGDPAFLFVAKQANLVLTGQEGVTLEANYVEDAAGYPGTNNFDNPWGTVHAAGNSISATTNFTSVDNGASSANGIAAILHVTASSGGTWAFKIQDSPDDAAWADVVTFSGVDGSATTSLMKTATGTIDRYTRLVATRTSGTVTVWASLARQ